MNRLRTTPLRDILNRQGFALGMFLEITSPQIVEMLGLAGWDFVIVDREHGSYGLQGCEEMVRAAASTGICPMVRAPYCDEVAIRQPLDLGAAGVHVPHIHSAEMARRAVRGAKFHPLGERGMHPFVRGASFGSYPTAEYLERANRETALVVHIEGTEGVEHIEEILAVEGVDVVFVGPYDLSQSLGIPGQIDSPLVREKMQSVIRAARERNVVVGTWAKDAQSALEWRDLGVAYLTVSLDATVFLEGARRLVEGIRGDRRR